MCLGQVPSRLMGRSQMQKRTVILVRRRPPMPASHPYYCYYSLLITLLYDLLVDSIATGRASTPITAESVPFNQQCFSFLPLPVS